MTDLEFGAYRQGFDDGAAVAWRTMAALVRAGVSTVDLAQVIGAMHEASEGRQTKRRLPERDDG
jgi:hypothetical protein